MPAPVPVVLYIEDDPLNQKLISKGVERHFAADVVIATTAAQGVAAALDLKPALVLLDLGLPDGHGSTVVAAMRGDERTAAIPIYALTGDHDERTRLEVLGAGATGYLTKPIDIQELFKMLDDHGLRRSR